jgi:hypothetical protein
MTGCDDGRRVRLSTSNRITLIGLGLAQAAVIVAALLRASERLAVVETRVEQLGQEIRDLRIARPDRFAGPVSTQREAGP